MSKTPSLDVEARWFAGKGRSLASTRIADEFSHGGASLTLVDVVYGDGSRAPEAGATDGGAAGAPGGGATDDGAADGGAAGSARERYLLTPDEPGAWGALIGGLLDGPLAGDRAGGRLELRAAPALGALIDLAGGLRDAPVTVPATDQTNTLVVLGGRVLVKAYRRLEAGVHPEVEVLGALAGRADAPVPRFGGAIVHVDGDGAETAVALLQEFVAGAEAGWEDPILAVAALLRAGDPDALVAPAAVAPYRAAGRVAASLHAALADTLSVSCATRADLAGWRVDAEAALAEAAAGDASLGALADAVRAELSAFGAVQAPPLCRIHGDLHYAQLLRIGPGGAPPPPAEPPAAGRLLVIDFEGDPTRPLAARRAPDTPLRDLACLLRSIDHIGSAASRRVDWRPPDDWIAAARAAAIEGYEERSPFAIDHRLLRALEVARECSELVYAQRVLPEWAYAPRLGLRRMLAEPDPSTETGPRPRAGA